MYFVNISCGPVSYTTRYQYAHTHALTVFHTHIVYLFLYSGQLDPSSQTGLSCFSSSKQRHGLGVVASQSVAACGFPRVCFSLHLSPSLFLSTFPFVPLFSPRLPLFASFLFLHFILLSAMSFSSSSSPFLSLRAQFWLRYSTVCWPIAAPHSLPSWWWLAAAYHSACWLLSMGGPGFCII